MKKHPLLILLVGLPISLVALYLSAFAFLIAYHNRPPQWDGDYRGLLWFLPGVIGLWAVFTGMRNLSRFATAHTDLRWHDWIGGVLGFLVNLFFLFFAVSQSIGFLQNREITPLLWIYLLILPILLAPVICFGIVLGRCLIHKKSFKP